MKLSEFFKSLGYDIRNRLSFEPYINLWSNWYKGKVKDFHTYTIYNGMKDINKERLSLQVAKFVSEKMADLLYNEKVKINLGDDTSNDILQEIFRENNFHVLMNRGIEKTFATGTGCITVDIDNINISDIGKVSYDNSNVRINFISAEDIFPLSWDTQKIKELAIVEYDNKPDGLYCIIKIHAINEQTGNYNIMTHKLKVDPNNKDNYILIDSEDELYINGFDTKNSLRWFIPITPNIVNNVDMYSPYGISIFGNSIDVLKGIDTIYDSFVNEINLGRKRIFATKEVMKFETATGTYQFNFDPNDIVFYVLGDGFSSDSEAKKYVQEINGTLRITDHVQALDSSLRLLGAKTGFGSDYFTFDKQTLAPKTATQVVSENSELFRTIKKHEQVLESAITELVHLLAYIGELTGKYYLNTDIINIDFDDSVIRSKEQERNDDRQDLAQNTLSRADYIKTWRNVDIETAKQMVYEIDNEKEPDEGIRFVEGEIN